MAEEMEGWVKLHRCLLDKAIWKNSKAEQKAVLITILLLANHKDNEWEWQGKKYTCKPGQFVTSLQSLAETSGTSVQVVRTSLRRFEKYEFLTDESTKTGRLITIVNWEFYQAKEDKPNKATNKDLTDNQQTANKDLTPNKNDKKDKKDKNNIYTPEFEEWYSKYPRPQAKHDSFKNFEKVRKEHGLETINKCTQNYLTHFKSLPEDKKEFAYASNNFFGQKAYFLNYIEPPKIKYSPKLFDELGDPIPGALDKTPI